MTAVTSVIVGETRKIRRSTDTGLEVEINPEIEGEVIEIIEGKTKRIEMNQQNLDLTHLRRIMS
jgi:uncharacterized FlaG/YvyC family protein